MIHFVYVWCVIVFLVMVPKYVIDVAIIWLNDNIYSRNTWFPTTDVQTQNIGKPRYANRRAPTECRHTVATQATEYQRWRDVSCRSRRCRPMPTLGQRRNASWVPNYSEEKWIGLIIIFYHSSTKADEIEPNKDGKGTYQWLRPLLMNLMHCFLISPWTKWPPFRRQHFQMHFHPWKC